MPALSPSPARIAVLYVPGVEHHVQESLIAAFRCLGHAVRIWRLPDVDEAAAVKEPSPGAPSEVRRWERWLASMRAFRPDFGFGVDTFPILYEPPRLRAGAGNPTREAGNPPPLRHLLEAAGAPLAIFWTHDPIRGMLALDSAPPMGLSRTGVAHFVPDTAAAAALRRLGLRAAWLPHGTSFHGSRPSGAAQARFRAAVAFVGRAADRAPGFGILRARYGTWAERFVRAAARRVAEGAPGARAAAGAIAALRPGEQARARATTEIPMEMSYLLRQTYGAAAVAARWALVRGLGRTVTVYGGPDDWPWGALRVRRRPPVDYATELPAVYRATDVNLNLTGHEFAAGANQRVFDAPASGGFLLTDRRVDLARCFAVGRDVIVYDDIADLRGKARWYLARPRERRRVVERAQARIAAEHAWVERARRIATAMV